MRRIFALERRFRAFAFLLCLTIATARAFAQGSESLETLNPALSAEGLQKFEQLLTDTKTRQALVMHKGKIVAEWYWLGSEPTQALECWSLSKSMASTAIGFLVDEGKIKSIDEPVSKYIPSWGEGDKSKITIAMILDQQTGIRDVAALATPADLLQKCIDAPLIEPPGSKSRYNNGGCNLISAVVSAAAGEDIETYMRRKMWGPLGMENTKWRRDEGGHVITYAGVQSTARDLVKFGQLFLDGGKWRDDQVLSKSWIDEATRPRTNMAIQGVGPVSAYGLLWWVDFKREEIGHNYSALGLWGNHLTVIPEKELIGVRLVGNNSDGGALMRMVPEWVAALAGVLKN